MSKGKNFLTEKFPRILISRYLSSATVSSSGMMSNKTYERIQKETEKYFPGTERTTNEEIYDTCVRNALVPSYLNHLPSSLVPSSHQTSILNKMRTLGDSNDLGLPKLNEVTLYDPLDVSIDEKSMFNQNIVPRFEVNQPNNDVLPNWKLDKIVLGHTGQVSSLCIDPFNSYYMTGSSDKTIKIWDIVSNELQLTLSGHLMTIKDIKISDRLPYMFSCSEDKLIKCWDLEKNQVIRDYHGHLSSVNTLDLHPELNLLVSGGRDSSVRVWDIRTKLPIHILSGHKGSINKVQFQSVEPQLVSCSADATLKTWDLSMGKCLETLTFNSKNIKAFIIEDENVVTASSNGLKQFHLPELTFLRNFQNFDHDSISEGNLVINSMSNFENILFVGSDNGKFGFFNLNTGLMYQEDVQTGVPGSLDSENGILCSNFDMSGDKLITGNIDKSIRIFKKIE